MKQHTIQIAIALALLTSPVIHAQDAVQWNVSDGGNGHWYKKIQTGGVVSWTSAKAQAEALGGQLSCHETPAENQYVWQTAVQPTLQGWDAWIGLQRVNGQWHWLSGPTTYTSWTFNSPDGDCGGADFAHFHQNGPTWNDLTENGIYCFTGGAACGSGHVCSFLVEWSADCNNDGFVDYGQILQGQLADTNTDGIPDTCQCGTIPSLPACCPGDLDHDAAVGGADIGLLLSNWGPCTSACLYDLNNDGKVNGGDLGLLLSGWGPCSN